MLSPPLYQNLTVCCTLTRSYRAKHGAPALSWDTKLAAAAQAWVDSCPSGLSDNPYGENMAWGYDSLQEAAGAWYAEVRRGT